MEKNPAFSERCPTTNLAAVDFFGVGSDGFPCLNYVRGDLFEKEWLTLCRYRFFTNSSAVRIMGSQNWWGLEIPEPCYTDSNPSIHRRVQWFLGWLNYHISPTWKKHQESKVPLILRHPEIYLFGWERGGSSWWSKWTATANGWMELSFQVSQQKKNPANYPCDLEDSACSKSLPNLP